MQLIEGASILVSPKAATQKCLVIVGSVHGNEPVGARAIAVVEELIASHQWHIEGAVFSLIGNPRAVAAGTRFCDENLNRAFGRTERDGSYETKRAEEITKWFSEIAQAFSEMYLLDLHSVSTGDTKMVIYSIEHKQSVAWAKRVSPIPFAISERGGVLPGALTQAFEKAGGTAVTIECGNHTAPEGEKVALEHIENALVSLGMMLPPEKSFRGLVPYEGPPRTYELIAPIKPRQCFTWDLPVASEMPLKAGQQYAHDDFGIHTASQDCYIMMPTAIPEPTDFDAGFLAIKTS